MTVTFYHRKVLVKRIADELQGVTFESGGSGLFFAAPRRVGKSTFLKIDLIPEPED